MTSGAAHLADAVTIRPATAADLPALVTLRTELNRHERAGCPHASIQPLNLEEFTAVWGRTLEHADYCWRVVEAAGRPAGFGLIYVTMAQVPAPPATLHWAYLEPGLRRRGVGQRLLDELLAWARARGASRVELQFIDGNEPARQFWSKMGFRPFATKCVLSLERESTA